MEYADLTTELGSLVNDLNRNKRNNWLVRYVISKRLNNQLMEILANNDIFTILSAIQLLILTIDNHKRTVFRYKNKNIILVSANLFRLVVKMGDKYTPPSEKYNQLSKYFSNINDINNEVIIELLPRTKSFIVYEKNYTYYIYYNTELSPVIEDRWAPIEKQLYFVAANILKDLAKIDGLF